MSERLGTVVFDTGHNEVFIGRTMAQARSYSEDIASAIDEEIHAIIDRAYKKCEEILTANRNKLDLTAEFLLEHETMSAEEFELVFTDPAALEAISREKNTPASPETETTSEEE
jgi:cell division protease FtsH